MAVGIPVAAELLPMSVQVILGHAEQHHRLLDPHCATWFDRRRGGSIAASREDLGAERSFHCGQLETSNRPIRFGEKDTRESLLDLAGRMLEVLHRSQEPGTEIVGVEQPFEVPLIDLDTGEVLDRALVGTLDLVERDAAGRLVVVDLKTSARRYTDLQVEASLQLSVYSYATAMNGLADQEDLRLRFDVLTKTKQPELCRYWTQRDRGASVRLFHLAAEVLRAIEMGVFVPNPGWQCKDCPFRGRCWAWR
jgi:putative RecB family exonuclease